MTTAIETRRLIEEQPAQWLIPLMDFVDDFRYYRDPKMIREPFPLHSDKFDALLAGVIQCLCDELDMTTPRWVLDVPPAPRAWFVSGLESLKATALIETPLPLRMRRVFVLGNFLSRI